MVAVSAAAVASSSPLRGCGFAARVARRCRFALRPSGSLRAVGRAPFGARNFVDSAAAGRTAGDLQRRAKRAANRQRERSEREPTACEAGEPTARTRCRIRHIMASLTTDETRRRFLGQFSALGLGGTLLPGVLWAEMQQTGAQQITPDMLQSALAMSGLSFSEEDQKAMLRGGQPEPDALHRAARDPDSERRVAAVSLQRARAGHDGQPDEAAVSHEHAGGQAAGQSRGGGVLARRAARAVDQDAAGDVDRAHTPLSRSPAPLQPDAQLRGHDSRRSRARAGEAGRRRDRRRQVQRAAARHSLGREGHHRGQGLQDHVGLGRLSRIKSSTTTRASSRCCATPARCWSPS